MPISHLLGESIYQETAHHNHFDVDAISENIVI